MTQKMLIDESLIQWLCTFAVCDMDQGFDRQILMRKLYRYGLIDFRDGEYHVKEKKKEVFTNKCKFRKKY